MEKLFYKSKRIGYIGDKGSWSIEDVDCMLKAMEDSVPIEARGPDGVRYIEADKFKAVITEKLGFLCSVDRHTRNYI